MSNDTSQISEREREILRLVAMGATNQQIASQLHISINTVKVHLRNIFEKIGVASRTEATVYAIRQGLVQLDDQPNQLADRASIDFASDIAPPPPEPLIEPVPLKEDLPDPVLMHAALLSAPDIPAIVIEQPRSVATARRPIVALAAIAVAVLLVGTLAYFLLKPQSPPTGATPAAAPVASPAQLNQWKKHAAWPHPRADFAVTAYEGKLYAIGGATAAGPSSALDRYDPAQDQWVSLNEKPTPVTQVQAVTIGGRIYIPGGEGQNGEVLTTFEAYDPRSQRWEALPALPAPRSRYALAGFEGQLYLFGGWDGSQARKEVFNYNPASKKWAERTSMQTARSNAGAALVEERIYVIGGENAQGAVRANERFDPTNSGASAWESVVPLAAAIATPAVVGTVDSVLVFDPELRTVTQYSPAKDSWATPLTIPPNTAISSRALPLSTSIFLFGPPAGSEAGALSEYQVSYTTLFPVIGTGQ
jgi:DNA-binding CsgD family transcriptional regulator